MDVGAWGVGAEVEVIGLEVTNTVIWLGEIVLEEAGICMTELTLVTGLGLGLGFRAELAEFRAELAGFKAELEFELVLTVEAGLL